MQADVSGRQGAACAASCLCLSEDSGLGSASRVRQQSRTDGQAFISCQILNPRERTGEGSGARGLEREDWEEEEEDGGRHAAPTSVNVRLPQWRQQRALSS